VSAEEGLGKTFEFIPQQVAHSSTPSANPLSVEADIPKANLITTLMTSMMSGQVPHGYEQKKHYGQVRRLNQGLMLTPRLTLNGMEFKGEVFTLYNGGKLALDLQESWFSEKGVKAVSLSSTTIAPKQSAQLYRISEVSRG
jgi:type-F conjugative transfer system secretin TraK